MTTLSEIEKRRSDRISLSLSAVVKARHSREDFWKETTDLISISRSGAGFYLENECQVGQLVSLLMAMPRHLRCYDHEKELYRVWGLVQHCSPISRDAGDGYHVGVAFIGKRSPASYKENPMQSYRISGMNEDGTWKIIEALASFVVRRHHRFWISLEASVSALDAEDNFISDESAATENISLSGAAVFSSLKVDVGESVKFNSKDPEFSALAIVRNRQTSDHKLPTLHLEFIDAEFPIEKIILPNEDDDLDELIEEPEFIEGNELRAEEDGDAPIEEVAEFSHF